MGSHLWQGLELGCQSAKLLLQHSRQLRDPEQQGPQKQLALALPWTFSLQHYGSVQAQVGMQSLLLSCWEAKTFSLQASPTHSQSNISVMEP